MDYCYECGADIPAGTEVAVDLDLWTWDENGVERRETRPVLMCGPCGGLFTNVG